MAATPELGPTLPATSDLVGKKYEKSKLPKTTKRALGKIAATSGVMGLAGLAGLAAWTAHEYGQARFSNSANSEAREEYIGSISPNQSKQVSEGFARQIINIAPLAVQKKLGEVSNGTSASVHIYDKSGEINLTVIGRVNSEGTLTDKTVQTFSVTRTDLASGKNIVLLNGNKNSGQWQAAGSVEAAATAVGKLHQTLVNEP